VIKILFRALPVFAMLALAGYLLWDSYNIRTERLTISINGLPKSFDGFTIAHISDIHGRKLYENGAAFNIISRANPDMVSITGDFVTSSVDEMYNFLPLLKRLSLEMPVYAVSGNHDHDVGWAQVKNKLQENDVIVLENEHVLLRKGNEKISIAGVNDPFTRRANLAKALPEDDIVTILLAHSPTWFEAKPYDPRFLEEIELLKRVSLTLVGHTHGGQIKIPFVGPLTTASGRLFPEDYIEGLSWEGSGWLYISRGIGYVMIPFRFLSPPEIAIITLRKAD
jgi:predicted MPP superfamily phosphohydrolase